MRGGSAGRALVRGEGVVQVHVDPVGDDVEVARAEVRLQRRDARLRDGDQAVGARHRAAHVGEEVLVAPVAALEVRVEGAHVDRGARGAQRPEAQHRRGEALGVHHVHVAQGARHGGLEADAHADPGDRPVGDHRHRDAHPQRAVAVDRQVLGVDGAGPGLHAEGGEAGEHGHLVAAGDHLAAEVVDVLRHAAEHRVGVLGDHRDPHGAPPVRRCHGRGYDPLKPGRDREGDQHHAGAAHPVEPPVVCRGDHGEQHADRPQEREPAPGRGAEHPEEGEGEQERVADVHGRHGGELVAEGLEPRQRPAQLERGLGGVLEADPGEARRGQREDPVAQHRDAVGHPEPVAEHRVVLAPAEPHEQEHHREARRVGQRVDPGGGELDRPDRLHPVVDVGLDEQADRLLDVDHVAARGAAPR